MRDPKLMIIDHQYDMYDPVGCSPFLQKICHIHPDLLGGAHQNAVCKQTLATEDEHTYFLCGAMEHVCNKCPRIGRGGKGDGRVTRVTRSD